MLFKAVNLTTPWLGLINTLDKDNRYLGWQIKF